MRVRAALVVAAAVLAAAVAGASAAVFWAAPIALGAALVLAVATWYRPVVGAVVAVAVTPALSGLSRGLVLPGVKVSELLLVVCIGALVLRRPDRWRAVSATDVAVLGFALAGLGFAVWHTANGTSTFESMTRVGLQPAFFALAYWVASRSVQRPSDLVVTLRWLLVVSVVPAVLALLQFLDTPGVGEALIDVTEGTLAAESRLSSTRATGPFPIWHSLGGYLLVPTVLAAVLLLRGDRRVLSRPWLVGVLLVDLAALVSAVTVTLLLWVPVALLVAAALSGRLLRSLALLAVLAVAVGLAFPSVLQSRFEEQATQTQYTAGGVLPQTVEYRILVWERDYLPLASRAAATGLGNDLPAQVLFPSTENQYLTLLLRGGALLPLAMIVALAALTVRAWRHARAPDGSDLEDPAPSVARSATLTALGILAFLPAAMMVWPYISNAGLSQALAGFAGAALALEPVRRSASRALGGGPTTVSA